jgi:diacylglycerol O-acyltransferase / wax synthase
MAYTHFDRLTALDSAFLDLESPGVHLHVGSVAIFDPGPLAAEGGGIDFERLLEIVESGLQRAPRFRQKLARTPGVNRPVWVDDEHFNVLYHVRHTALPLPGDERRLKRLVGRIMSEKLDRGKPMWELWFVEGLEGGRMGVISKVHHCLIDGISGVDLLSAFMGRDPSYRAERAPHRWIPRPAPSGLSLLGHEIQRRAALPRKLAGGLLGGLVRRESRERGRQTASAFFESLGASLSPASPTPFNVPIGPHRRFDWTRFDLGVVREVKTKLGGTVNDLVLACVAGAVREHLGGSGMDLSETDFRVFVPVSTRQASERGKLGNRVSMLVLPLPVGEADPRRRLERISSDTRQRKESGQARGTELVEQLSEWTTPGLLTGFTRLAAARRSYNLVVTNVPGPAFPVYMEGARLLQAYPLVPLFSNQALGIALLSYDDGLYWGFNADWDALAGLHDLVQAVEREFETLRKL